MQVLHVDTGRTMRGGQWQLLLLARGLRARGIEQTLLARGELLARLQAEGFAVRPASWWQVRRTPASVVHVHDAHAHTWAVVAGRHPLVVSRRVAFKVKTGPLSQWKYARAQRFLAVSQFVADRLIEAGVPAGRVRVVYDGAEAQAETHPIQPGGTLIVTPYFDDSRKGSVILKETGLDVKYSSNLPADLKEAKLFVYLTYEEGLGSAVLLAQAAGVPVVASRVGGLPEIVLHEETGLLTENDPAAAKAAIQRLVGDPALAARLAGKARRRFHEMFTVDHMVESTVAAYQELFP